MPLGPLQAGDPTRVGGYQLTARLGAGAMGIVFLGLADDATTIKVDDTPGRPAPRTPPQTPRVTGTDGAPADGRLVAVKLIHGRIADAPDYRGRFRREVAAARAVAGTCTARVLAADPDAPRPWLATEYIDGPSLAEAVDLNGPLSASTVEALAVGLAEALVAIHRAGIVHRDLKPANVLVTTAGPKVIDFGMALPTNPATRVDITQTGAVVGSPGYLAPEQAEGRRAGPAADVWAWALTVAFAATGRPPFGTGTAEALLFRSMTTEPDLAGVPPRLLAILRTALRRDPAGRPSTTRLLASLIGETPDPGAAAARVLEVLWQPPDPAPSPPPPPSPWPTTAPSPPAAAPPPPTPAAFKALTTWAPPAAQPGPTGGQPWYAPPAPHPTPATTPQPPPTPAPGHEPATPRGLPAPSTPATTQPTAPRRGWFAAAAAAALLLAGLVGAGIAAIAINPNNDAPPGPVTTTTATASAAQAAGVANPGDTELLAGLFTGTYRCNQGVTALRLVILDNPAMPGRITAVFSFAASATNPGQPAGSYAMEGTFEGNAVQLNGRRWLEHPAGYVMVGLSGTYAAESQTLSGRVSGTGCSTFSLSKTR